MIPLSFINLNKFFFSGRFKPGPEELFKCEECSKVFKERAYKQHKLTHEINKLDQGKKKFQCDICKRYFITRVSYSSHFQNKTILNF